MFKNITRLQLMLTTILLLGLVAVIYSYVVPTDNKESQIPENLLTPSDIPTEADIDNQLPNPASVYCVDDLNGELRIVETSEGQVGVCHLPDDRWCEEWELYRTNTCVLPGGISDAELYGKG